MSVTEQEIKAQVADMQRALEEIDVSRRRAGVTKLVGTVAAILVVVTLVVSFVWNVRSLAERRDEFVQAFQKRIAPMGLTGKFTDLATELGPIVQKEAQKLAKELQENEKARAQLTAMWEEDMLPILKAKAEEVRPDLEKAAESQRKLLIEALQEKLQAKINERLRVLIQEQETDIRTGTGIAEEQIDGILAMLRESSEEAAANVVKRKLKELDDVVNDIVEHQGTILARGGPEEGEDEEKLMPSLLRLIGYNLVAETAEEDEETPEGEEGE